MKLLHAVNHHMTTAEVVKQAIDRCKKLRWTYIHAGSDYAAIIIAWNDKQLDSYREMVVIDGMSETLVVKTTEGYTPAFDPAIAKKLESFQINHQCEQPLEPIG